jgi:hypothetical protein
MDTVSDDTPREEEANTNIEAPVHDLPEESIAGDLKSFAFAKALLTIQFLTGSLLLHHLFMPCNQ